jgi:hypothetical protein
MLMTVCCCLQGVIDRRIEIGRYFEMKMNGEECKVMRVYRQPSTLQIIRDQKQLENMEKFQLLV